MEVALQQSFDRFLHSTCIGSSDGPNSQALLSYYTACYKFDVDTNICTAVTPSIIEHINDIILILERHADCIDVRDNVTEDTVINALEAFLQRGLAASGVSNLPVAVNHFMSRHSPKAGYEEVNAIEIGLYIVTTIYTIQYAGAFSRITRLLKYIITVMMNAPSFYIFKALYVFKRILIYVQKLQVLHSKKNTYGSLDHFGLIGGTTATNISMYSNDYLFFNSPAAIWEQLAKDLRDLAALLDSQIKRGVITAGLIRKGLTLMLLAHVTLPFFPLNCTVLHTDFKMNLFKIAHFLCGFYEEPLLQAASIKCIVTLFSSRNPNLIKEAQLALIECEEVLTKKRDVVEVVRALHTTAAFIKSEIVFSLDKQRVENICNIAFVMNENKSGLNFGLRQALNTMLSLICRCGYNEFYVNIAKYLMEPFSAKKCSDINADDFIWVSNMIGTAVGQDINIKFCNEIMYIIFEMMQDQGPLGVLHDHSSKNEAVFHLGSWTIIKEIVISNSSFFMDIAARECANYISSSIISKPLVSLLSFFIQNKCTYLSEFESEILKHAKATLIGVSKEIAYSSRLGCPISELHFNDNFSTNGYETMRQSPLGSSDSLNEYSLSSVNVRSHSEDFSKYFSHNELRTIRHKLFSSKHDAEKVASNLSLSSHIDSVICAIEVIYTIYVQPGRLVSLFESTQSVKDIINIFDQLTLHSVNMVRAYSGCTMAKLFFKAVKHLEALDKFSNNSEDTCSFRDNLAFFISSITRNIAIDPDQYVRALIARHVVGQEIVECSFPVTNEVYIPESVFVSSAINDLVGLLQGTKYVRESVLSLLLATEDSNGLPKSVQAVLQQCMSTHTQTLSHVIDAFQVCRSCAIVTLLLVAQPRLLTAEFANILMRSICNKLDEIHSGVKNMQWRGKTLGGRIIPDERDGGSKLYCDMMSEDNFSIKEGDTYEYRREVRRTKAEWQMFADMAQSMVLLELFNTVLVTMKSLQRLRLTTEEESGEVLSNIEAFAVITESTETKSMLNILWNCLKMTSRSITAISSVSDKVALFSAGIFGEKERHNITNEANSESDSVFDDSQGSISQLNNAFKHSGFNGSENGSSEPLPVSAAITNVIAVQHQTLCALTALLAMCPQDIVGFAHKTAFMDFLCTEYLRSCGLTHLQAGEAANIFNTNAMAALLEQTTNHRNRLSIIRLFGLLGAIDPVKGQINMMTADSSAVVVEGDAACRKSFGAAEQKESGAMSVRTRAIILKNVDATKDIYPFAKGPSYCVTVYRVLVELFSHPRAVSDRVLSTALRITLIFLREFSAEQVQGWDLIEAAMVLARMRSEDVSPEIKTLALTVLPDLIRLRKKVATQLIQEFFSTVLQCWNRNNERMCVSLLTLVKELHLINLEVSETCSSNYGSGESRDTTIMYGGISIPAPINREYMNDLNSDEACGNSLYLRLVGLALNDHSPHGEIAHLVIDILSLVHHQETIAPIIVGSFIEHIVTSSDANSGLRIHAAKMVSTLIARYKLSSYATQIVIALYNIVWFEMKSETLTRQMLAKTGEILNILSSGGFDAHPSFPLLLFNIFQSLFTHTTLTMPNNLLTASSPIKESPSSSHMLRSPSANSDAFSQNDVDVFAAHVHKALKEGLRRGRSFNWSLWFYDLQRHILLHSPHAEFRISFDLFDQHEPCRKALFYPAFHCMFVNVFVDKKDIQYTAAANAIRKPLRRALSHLLRFADSETVDMCLGLHDYLERYRAPPDWTSTEVAESARTSEVSCFSDEFSFDFFPTVVKCGTMQSTDALTKWNRHGSGKNFRQLGFSLPNVKLEPARDDERLLHGSMRLEAQLGLKTMKDINKMEVSETSAKPSLQQKEKHNWSLPTPLFRQDELVKSAQENGLYFKTVRYLELKLSSIVKITDKNKPRDPIPVFINLTEKKPSKVNPIVSSLVDTLAKQYSCCGELGQQSVCGLYAAISTGIDPTGYELLKRWKEANIIYGDRIAKYMRDHSDNSLSPVTLGNKPSFPFSGNQTPPESSNMDDDDSMASPLVVSCRQRITPRQIICDFTGYLRTLCYTGQWEEGLKFANEHLTVLRQASALSKGIMRYQGSVHSINSIEIDSESPHDYAIICAAVLKKWENVRVFENLIVDKSKALLFKHITMAEREIEKNNADLHLYAGFAASVDKGSFTGASNTRVNAFDNNLTRALVEIDEKLKTMLPLSYSHSYTVLTHLQHFQEVEEARLYSRRGTSQEFRSSIRQVWFQRFQSLRSDAISMLTSLLIYSLVARPREISEVFYCFSKAMRQTHPSLGMWALCCLQRNSMEGMGSEEMRLPVAEVNDHGGVESPLYSKSAASKDALIDYYEYLWSSSHRNLAIQGLSTFLNASKSILIPTAEPTAFNETLARYGRGHNLLGEWLQEMNQDKFWKKGYREEIIYHLHIAVESLPEDYETWHSLALMNYRVFVRDKTIPPDEQEHYMHNAQTGFVSAVCKASSRNIAMQDVLRLLQLWFSHQDINKMEVNVIEAVQRIPAADWCRCLPQVIAHLAVEDPKVWRIVRTIMKKACESYPQQCIFNLLVPVMSCGPELIQENTRARRARCVLLSVCSPTFYHEATQVAQGFIQLASFPIEDIYEALSTVAKLLESATPEEPINNTIFSLINSAIALSQKDAKLTETVGDIAALLERLMGFLYKPTAASITDAQRFSLRLYMELQEHVNEMKRINLREDNILLSELHDLSVWVPNDYSTDAVNPPTIHAFIERVDVIDTKRRPRRVHIVGSDGNLYTYCLKGNEDLRVDARAMQLFAMINSFSETECPISCVSVVSFSENVGILGWLENSETLFKLLKNFRLRANISEEAEQKVIEKDYSNVTTARFHNLPNIQKTEMFEHMYSVCPCDDLRKVFWYRSVNAELWLRRRSTLTASLAYASPVGYILGLGDRHPGNLLIQVSTGNVMHIDFGDCFDVARFRSGFPETVPFRLTPMMITSMEVFGVCGIFQFTSEESMTLLRKYRDSIHALLSAFAQDPVMDKRWSQENIGNGQAVLNSVRRKLHGVEMPNDVTIDWSTPKLAFADKNDCWYETEAYNDQWEPYGARKSVDIHFKTETCSSKHFSQREKVQLHEGESLSSLPPRPDLRFMLSKEAHESTIHILGLNFEVKTPKEQVKVLIEEATKEENLCHLFPGWTPWW